METLLYKQTSGNILLTVGNSTVKMWWIAAEDYAKQVVNDYKQNPVVSREYYVQGIEGLTMNEAIEIFRKNYRHKKFLVVRMPLNFIRMAGWIKHEADYGYQILDGMNNFPEKFEAEKTWEQLGEPETTLEMYAENL